MQRLIRIQCHSEWLSYPDGILCNPEAFRPLVLDTLKVIEQFEHIGYICDVALSHPLPPAQMLEERYRNERPVVHTETDEHGDVIEFTSYEMRHWAYAKTEIQSPRVEDGVKRCRVRIYWDHQNCEDQMWADVHLELNKETTNV
ncbi:hypothetical protein D3C78_1573870 [compost metagenome]